MKAVKSLILEEIEAIKSQKGSLSLYPKSIMDLVFSEVNSFSSLFRFFFILEKIATKLVSPECY